MWPSHHILLTGGQNRLPAPVWTPVSVAPVPSGVRPLTGCVFLSGALGTIHAWSLFVMPLETNLDVGRGAMSAVYSVALACLTVVVLVGHPLFRHLPGALVATIAAVGAAGGLLLAAEASSLTGLVVGYGVVFGGANGLGYAFALQRSAEATPDRRGWALGLVTAAYALGAATAAVALEARIDAAGPEGGLRLLAGLILGAGLVSALLVGGVRSTAGGTGRTLSEDDRRLVGRLWGAYGLAVLAGLTALGHAAAVVEEAGGPDGVAVAVAGFACAVGGVWIALVADRSQLRRLLVGLPFGSVAALLLGASTGHGLAALAAVSGIAFTYGAVIAVYPFAVNKLFGENRYPAAYGWMFTAWGTAGLVGPIGAGLLFEATGSYGLPLLLAAVAAVGSANLARSLPAGPRESRP